MRWIGRGSGWVLTRLVTVGGLALAMVPAVATGSAAASPNTTVTVTGTVVNASGTAISGAEVTVDYGAIPDASYGSGFVTGFTNASGQYSVTLPGGDPSEISAIAPGYSAVSASPQDGGTTLVLSTAAFSGTVSDIASGYALSGVGVSLYDLSTGLLVGSATTDLDGYYAFGTSEVNVNDSYRIELTSPAEVYYEAGQPDGTPSSSSATALTPGATDQGDLDIAERPFLSEITGVVTDAAGPVAGATVELVDPSDPQRVLGPTTLTSSTGTYVLSPGDDPGALLAEAIPPLGSDDATTFYGSPATDDPLLAQPVFAAGEQNVNITLLSTASVTGVISNQAGSPEPGVAVTLEGCTGSYPGLTDASGDLSISGINPGTYAAVSGDPGQAQVDWGLRPSSAGPASGPASLDLGSGASGNLTESLPESGAISGQISVTPSPRAGATTITVEVFDARGDVVAVIPTTSGGYRLTGLPEGRYFVAFVQSSNLGLSGEFYGGSTTFSGARPVTITPGAVTTGVSGVIPAGESGAIGSAAVSLATPTPLIAGTPRIGHTLTANATGWLCQVRGGQFPAPTLAYQWLADGTVITGATGPSFRVGAADLGKAITVDVTGYAPGYVQTTIPSIATTPVAPATLMSRVPRISGAPRLGHVLTALPGSWTRGTRFTYQWYANGVKLTGATRSRLRLSRAEAGKRISVRVTGRRSDYSTVTRSSAATRPVIR